MGGDLLLHTNCLPLEIVGEMLDFRIQRKKNNWTQIMG